MSKSMPLELVSSVCLSVFCVGFLLGAILVAFFPGDRVANANDRCDCLVTYNNQSMSVQDALDRIIERYDGGLTTGQTIDVRTLINNSLEEK